MGETAMHRLLETLRRTTVAALALACVCTGAEPGAAAGAEPKAKDRPQTQEATQEQIQGLQLRLAARTRAFRNLLTHLRHAKQAYEKLEQDYAALHAETERVRENNQVMAELRQDLAASWAQIEELKTQIERAGPGAVASEAKQKRIAELITKGRASEETGEMEKAVWSYREALSEDANHFESLLLLGHAHVKRGDDVAAEKVLSRAFKLDPNDVRILIPLGRALLRQEKAELAVSMFARAIALEPKNAKFLQHLGVACRSLGWNAAAERALSRSVRLDPTNAESLYNLAILLATLESPRIEEAREWYESARKAGANPDANLESFFKRCEATDAEEEKKGE